MIMLGVLGTAPIWILAIISGIACQISKLMIYSAAQRRLAFSVLGESVGLPSLHATVLTCMTALLFVREGWQATETALSLVFAVIVIHDAMRLKSAAHQQKLALYDLTSTVPGAGALRHRAAEILNIRAHQPFHVGVGVLFGLFFALAFGIDPD